VIGINLDTRDMGKQQLGDAQLYGRPEADNAAAFDTRDVSRRQARKIQADQLANVPWEHGTVRAGIDEGSDGVKAQQQPYFRRDGGNQNYMLPPRPPRVWELNRCRRHREGGFFRQPSW
jgi:hypothetical protein